MSALKLDFGPDTTIVSLESQLERLSLESNVMSNVISIFRNIVPELASKLKMSFSAGETKLDLVAFKKAKGKLESIDKRIRFVKYVDYTETLVSVPEGFEGDLLTYIQVLSRINKETYQQLNKALTAYNFTLSAFITNKENKFTNKDTTEINTVINKHREQATDDMQAFFTKKSLSKAKLSKLISRFSDIDVVVKATDVLFQEDLTYDLTVVKTAVDKTVELLNIIIADTREDGLASVSGQAALNVSTTAHELAKYTELLVLCKFRTKQVVCTVEKLIDDLDSFLP